MHTMFVVALLGFVVAEGPGDTATHFLELCRDGKFAEAEAMFTPEVAKALPEAKLNELWTGVIAKQGGLKSLGTPRIETITGMTLARVRCEFSKEPLDALVSVTREGKIGGLYLAPAGATDAAVKTPAYLDPGKYEESDITVGAEGWPLPGTLTVPKAGKDFPIVVMVHGSGPNDRDESIGPNAPFRDLARGLAAQGVATIRYDKRTFALKKKFMEMPKEYVTIDTEVIDDALAALAKARSLPMVDNKRVYVIGHSLGGSAGPDIAKRDGKLAGLILLAPADRQPDVIILDQIRFLNEADAFKADGGSNNRERAKAAFEKIRSGEAKPDEMFMGGATTYWKSWMALQPAKTAASLKSLPMLVLRGDRDYQVVDEDYQAFQTALKGRTDVEFHLYPGLNHLFHKGEGKASPADYMKKGYVEEQVVDDVARFINSRK